MKTQEVANELLPRLYAAACGEGEWTDFLGPLADVTRSPIAHVLSATLARRPAGRLGGLGGQRQWIRQVGISVELLRILNEVGQPDPWITALSVGDFREGWVGRDSEIVPREVMDSTEYYRTIMEPHDLVKAVGLLLLKRPGEIAVGGLIRGADDPDFEDDVVELMRVLCPHLTAAVRVFNRVGDLEHRAESLELALGQFAIGVALLDREGKVIFANAVAERQLEGRDGLLVQKQSLRSLKADETRKLRAEIERAIRISEDGVGGARGAPRLNAAPITRRQAGPLHVFAAPWMSQREVSLRRPAAVLLITEPEHRVPRETWLQALYGLTPAESKLAVLIAGGMHGPEAARLLGLSAETVRSRLKTVFNKTNTRRQSDLARLLAGLPRG